MRRVLSLFMVLVLTFSVSTDLLTMESNASQLNDIANHWAKSYIQELVDMKAINGYPDGTFRPNDNISRGAFVKVLCTALELESSNSIYFSDTASHWANSSISAAAEAGIIQISEYISKRADARFDDVVQNDYLFEPDKLITREEMAKMITRAMGSEYKASKNSAVSFTDQTDITSSTLGFVAEASSLGIITGYPDGRFGPKNNATRAEASVMITRLLSQLDADITLTELASEDIYETYSKATVEVSGLYMGDWYELGSGFVYDTSGKVITNFHVIADLEAIKVTFADGTEKDVVSIGNYDWAYDIAILRLEAGTYDAVPLGSSRNLRMGAKVYAVGYPLVQNLSISDGIISSVINEDGIEMIQMTAPISPGSSGGALVNKYGEVIGITTATFYGAQNMNLAIPISNVMDMIVRSNNEFEVESAASYGFVFSDHQIAGTVDQIDVFFSTDIDMSEIAYEQSGSLSDYSYVGIDFELTHRDNLKKNQMVFLVGVLDENGDAALIHLFVQRMYKSGHTSNQILLDWGDLSYIGEGEYYIEVYTPGSEDPIATTDTFVITAEEGN